jgi:hypothetical protein
MTARTFMALPHLDVSTGEIRVSDRTADLNSAIVHLGAPGASMHIEDPVIADKLAEAFSAAASMLRAGLPT